MNNNMMRFVPYGYIPPMWTAAEEAEKLFEEVVTPDVKTKIYFVRLTEVESAALLTSLKIVGYDLYRSINSTMRDIADKMIKFRVARAVHGLDFLLDVENALLEIENACAEMITMIRCFLINCTPMGLNIISPCDLVRAEHKIQLAAQNVPTVEQMEEKFGYGWSFNVIGEDILEIVESLKLYSFYQRQPLRDRDALSHS
ncbi:unnamed protein product [Caenorhabditis auriculariae]|uniref:Uncharacterized protein n=1 Tax=Caenorhabditis auriculariae TaxID=2777116 RepID=A0A8S1HPX5_9PELO|nr:unnamed protein product [Caenorhabditis auriculariae]